jgi:hypothetical protein
MTRQEALEEARRRQAEDPDRAGHRWMAHPHEVSGWTVTRVAMPAGVRVDPVTSTVESRPAPSTPHDPRPAHDRHVGGPYGPA